MTSSTRLPVLALIDGAPSSGLPLDDRGLAYGDGVFETILVHAGKPVWWAEHLQRLRRGASALGIEPPPDEDWRQDFAQLVKHCDDSRYILKLILTRGSGGRGYMPSLASEPRRISLQLPAPSVDAQVQRAGIAVRWCATRLADQPMLVGIKHLNRLEQVLARGEWQTPDIAEGLMLDSQSNVACATAANLFLVRSGRMQTPVLDRGGIHGVCRDHLRANFDVELAVLSQEDVLAADEVFVCSSVRGILPVVRLGERHWPVGETTRRCIAHLSDTHAAFAKISS